MFLAVDGRLAGLIAVADPIKATTPEAIRALHAAGPRVCLVSTSDAADEPPSVYPCPPRVLKQHQHLPSPARLRASRSYS